MSDDQAANSLNHYLDGSYEGEQQGAEASSAAQPHHGGTYAQPQQQQADGYYYQTQGEHEAEQQIQPSEQTYYSVEQQQQYHQHQAALEQAAAAPNNDYYAQPQETQQQIADPYQYAVETGHGSEQQYYQQQPEPMQTDAQGYVQPQQEPYQTDPSSVAHASLATGQQVETPNQYAGMGESTYTGEAAYTSYNTQTQGLEQGLAPQAASASAIPSETSQSSLAPAIYADSAANGGGITRNRLLFVGGAFALALAVTGGGYLIGTNFDLQKLFKSSATPTITANTSPAKISPKERGGRVVANKEKKIFDRLVANQPSENDVAPKRVAQADNSIDTAPGSDGNDITTAAIPAPKPVASAVGTPRMVKTSRIRADGTSVPHTQSKITSSEPVMAGIALDAPSPREPLPRKLVKREAKPIPAIKKTTAPASKPVKIARAKIKEAPHRLGRVAQPKTSRGSRYVVQIASRRSESEALSSLAGFKLRYGGNVDGYTPLIRKANLGSKGTWYRLQIGHMTSREKAGTVCSNLKKKGLPGCFVTKQ